MPRKGETLVERVKISCPCGVEFETKQHRIDVGRGRYCSKPCRYKYVVPKHKGKGKEDHGKVNTYDRHGCRCDLCKTAKSENGKRLREVKNYIELALDDSRHGTRNGYTNHGCRCERCIAAQKEYSLSLRESLPTVDSRHGTLTGYRHYKCRCESCKEAASKDHQLARKTDLSENSSFHGTITGYSRYACTCDACKAAGVASRKLHSDNRRSSTQRRRVRQKNNGPVEKFLDIEIFERDGWICQICFTLVDKMLIKPNLKSKSLDHIIPVAKGGTHTRSNVQLAHLECNLYKSDKVVN